MQEKIIILDFGSQTTQLIGRRLRELNMYCEIVPYNKFPHDDPSVIGVILSGSPFSVYDEKAFKTDLTEIRGKYPILGICYGAQFLAYTNGGTVESADSREYGRARLEYINCSDPLLSGIEQGAQVWMSHGDTITSLPENFKIIASTDHVPVAAYRVETKRCGACSSIPKSIIANVAQEYLKISSRTFAEQSRTGARHLSLNQLCVNSRSSSEMTRLFSD